MQADRQPSVCPTWENVRNRNLRGGLDGLVSEANSMTYEMQSRHSHISPWEKTARGPVSPGVADRRRSPGVAEHEGSALIVTLIGVRLPTNRSWRAGGGAGALRPKSREGAFQDVRSTSPGQGLRAC